MDIEELKALVQQGESETLEFKKSTSQLKAAMETICAYLNGSGGKVLIGIKDSGEIVGQGLSDNTQLEISNMISKIEPSPQVSIDILPLDTGKHIVLLEAFPNKDAIPYAFNGRPFVRVLSTTKTMHQDNYQRFILERANIASPWDSNVAKILTIDDLDHNEILNMLSDSINKGRIESRHQTDNVEKALRLLGLTNDDKILNAAAVLFMKNEGLSMQISSIRLARFKGVTKSNLIDSDHIYGNAFSILQSAESFYLKHISIESEFIPGKMARNDIPDYPPRAIREALVNAICHRDYSIPGGSMSLMIFDDRLEVTSHGNLPRGVSITDLTKDHDSQPRNQRITRAMYKRGIIESVGTGTQEMIEECKALGKPEPVYLERANTFVVQFKKTEALSPGLLDKLTPRQREIIDILKEHSLSSAKEITSKLKKSPAERTVREDLTKLKALGMIETQGSGPSTSWSLSELSGGSGG